MRRGSHALLLVALTVVAASMAPLAALIVDSGRDLAAALAIARGAEFAWYGPSLFGTWRPGPVWFYLLAVPLKLGGSVTAAALFAGALAAAKIPLAWALGRRARDATLGLALAAFVALPGWVTLGQLVLSHTMLVEASVLATLLLCLSAWQRGSAWLAALAVAMQALAIHAHPTTLVCAPAVAWAAWTCLIRTPRGVRWGALAAALALFVLPFLPAVLAEARSGWPQLAGSAGYFAHGDYLARLDRAGAVARGASIGQATLVRDFLFDRWPAVGWIAFAGVLLTMAAAFAGVLAGAWRMRGEVASESSQHAAFPRMAVALALALAGWLFVLLLRDATPAWMAYAPLTLQAVLLACGWDALWPARWRERAAVGLAAFALLLGGALLAARVAAVRDGTQSLPTAAISDIAATPQRDPPQRFWLPVFGHDAAFARFCATPGAVSVNGDLATALHFGQGVAAALHCVDPARVGFGARAPRTLAGVPRAVARELGIAGEATAWGYVLATPARVLRPESAQPFATHTRYLVDDYLARSAPPSTLRLGTACEANQVLAITDLVPGLNLPFDVRAVGDALPPLRAQTIASRYFACPPSGEITLDITAADAQAVGAVLIDAAPSAN